MKFSVIIPVYNCEEYLRRCLDSLVDQHYSDYELILIDDGSTDQSLAVCREYQEKYPQIKVMTQENGGPSIARNRGLSEASGDYLLFIDSDDYVSDTYFAVLDQTLRRSDADIVMFGSIGSISGLSAPENAALCGNKNIIGFYGSSASGLDYNSCCNKCFKRSAFSGIRFPEKTVVEEDLIYNLLALDAAESMRFLNVPLYYYDQRTSGSVTTKYNPNKFRCIVQAYDKKKEITQRWNDERVVEYFRSTYLIMISAAINNLLYKTCPLKYPEKLTAIEEMFLHPDTVECASKASAKSGRALMMKFLIRHRWIHIAFLIHWTVFHLKNRA